MEKERKIFKTEKSMGVTIKSFALITLLIGLVIPLISTSAQIESSNDSDDYEHEGTYAAIYANKFVSAGTTETGDGTMIFGGLETTSGAMSLLLLVMFVIGVISLAIGLARDLLQSKDRGSADQFLSIENIMAFTSMSVITVAAYVKVASLPGASTFHVRGRLLSEILTNSRGENFDLFISTQFNFVYVMFVISCFSLAVMTFPPVRRLVDRLLLYFGTLLQ